MFDQQLDVFGGAHDLAPKHVQPRMFEFPKTTPGQMPMPKVCDICSEPIEAGEKFSDDGSEIAHTACVSHWFSSNFGRERLG